MSVPKLNDNQFLALQALTGGRLLSGGPLIAATVYEHVSYWGRKMSMPGFYMLMQALEDGRYLKSRFALVPMARTKRYRVGDKLSRKTPKVRMKQYRILAKGRKAVADKLAFYAQFMEKGEE